MVGFALAIKLHLLLQTVQFESPIGPADSERLERGRERESLWQPQNTPWNLNRLSFNK